MARSQKVLTEVTCPKCGRKCGIVKWTTAWCGRCGNTPMRPNGEQFEVRTLSAAQTATLRRNAFQGGARTTRHEGQKQGVLGGTVAEKVSRGLGGPLRPSEGMSRDSTISGRVMGGSSHVPVLGATVPVKRPEAAKASQ